LIRQIEHASGMEVSQSHLAFICSFCRFNRIPFPSYPTGAALLFFPAVVLFTHVLSLFLQILYYD
jgi:hypothetical protein